MPIEGEQSRDTISRSAAALAVNAWGWRCWDTVLEDGLVVAGGAVAVCSESGTEAATGKGGVDFTCAGTGTGNGGVATCCAVITGADVCTGLSTGAGEGVLKRSIIFTIHNCICICINARSKADWEADPAADPSTITGTNESVPARFWLDGIRNWFPIRGSKKEGCWCILMDGSICGEPGAGSCTPRVESDGWGCLLLSPMTIPWFFRSCINCAVWCEDGLHGTSSTTLVDRDTWDLGHSRIHRWPGSPMGGASHGRLQPRIQPSGDRSTLGLGIRPRGDNLNLGPGIYCIQPRGDRSTLGLVIQPWWESSTRGLDIWPRGDNSTLGLGISVRS